MLPQPTLPLPTPAIKQHTPIRAWAGAKRPRLLIIGEAWGRTEDEQQQPLVGHSGILLTQILGEAGANRDDEERALHADAMRNIWGVGFAHKRNRWLDAVGIAMTNVLNFRPPDNKIDQYFVTRKETKSWDPTSPSLLCGPIDGAKYLDQRFDSELRRLADEITEAQPTCILAIGARAAWATMHTPAISAIRGTFNYGLAPTAPGVKCLGTYHPAMILRKWEWRPILLADCMKALRGAETKEITRPRRQVLINPTIEQIDWWIETTLASWPDVIGVDTETKAGQLTCLGFARDGANALVVPFWNFGSTTGSYWPTIDEELRVRAMCRRLLRSSIPKVFQNGMYDLQYLIRENLVPRALTDDTMLLHHSIFPEVEKSLGFLGSIYTDEASWKILRHRRGDDVEKADE